MKKIFIACDTNKVKTIKKVIKETQNKKFKIFYKVGMEFFYSKDGRNFIKKINKNIKIWLDLKLKDIPNTVSSSILSLKDLRNVKYLTVHCSGGYEMLKIAKKTVGKINKNMKLIGVTVLTSFEEKSFKKIGYDKSIKQIVIKQAKLARDAGLDGIVCSGQEIKFIKHICKKMEIFVPGIRFKKNSNQDQKRTISPSQAFKFGATGIVIGRNITKGNIRKNTKELINSLSS
tara:strand:- start:911 stop:1603 length:693 start_codon:yes stop_codon:yes gene_type:complete